MGFLRVGMEDPVKFSTLYTGANYVPEVEESVDGEARPRSQRQARVRIHQFTTTPIFDTAVS